MQETGLEGFGADTVQGGSNAPFEFTDLKGGFGIQNRLVLANPSTKEPLLGSTTRVRFRLEEGALFFEDVVASPGLLYSLARKQFGTTFEFGLGPFQSELQLLGRDTGSAHVRVFAPITLNPVGFANTDQDIDGALKYVFRAGAGAGVDATILAGSSFLIGLRGQGDYRYTYRAGEKSITHNRGDVEWIVDAGIGAKTSETTAVMALFTYQNWAQWEYDALTDGVQRGEQIIGGRLVFRAYSQMGATPKGPMPTVPPPEMPSSGG
jgi:hypothetical protein